MADRDRGRLPLSSLTPDVRQLLNTMFENQADLSSVDKLQSELETECEELKCKVEDLRQQAFEEASKGSRHLGELGSSLGEMIRRIEGLKEEGGGTNQTTLVQEISGIATAVAGIDQVRKYAESAMQLERMIGDLEDAVFATVSATPVISRGSKSSMPVKNSSSGKLGFAVKTLKSIEDVVGEIAANKPQWQRLISAVDVRVDRAVASLRPVAVADHRTVLRSIGWPPSLTISSSADKNMKLNPLLEIQVELQRRYFESFLSLSTLQAVQLKRRQRASSNRSSNRNEFVDIVLGNKRRDEPLWAIEELVSPISVQAEPHFQKWLHTPEFVFTLAHKITQEHGAVIDGLLQPMLDKTGIGYSAREQWVSALVAMVAEHLRKWVLPKLADLEYDEIWLHTVDEAIAFDRKMEALCRSGTASDGILGEILGLLHPCISVFADRSDWLELWAKLELGDAERKLRREIESEKFWELSSSDDEELKAPYGAVRVIRIAEGVINRCRNLRDVKQRLVFVKATSLSIFDSLLKEMMMRCQESEALTALSDLESMVKVGVCLNAARYCEHMLEQWGEEMFFFELRLAEKSEESGGSEQEDLSAVEGSIFDCEVDKFAAFRKRWLSKLVAVIARGFDARCRHYFRSKKTWLEEKRDDDDVEGDVDDDVDGDDDVDVSRLVVDAVSVLQSQVMEMKRVLDVGNMREWWQRVVSVLDEMMLEGLLWSGGGFRLSESGCRQLVRDVKCVMMVFKELCVRPESFFVGLSDACKILMLGDCEGAKLVSCFDDDDDDEKKKQWLSKLGVRKMSPSLVQKILRRKRIFSAEYGI